MIKAIFAIGTNDEFSVSDNTMPWNYVREDMLQFMTYTKDCVLIMGRKTWESLPPKKLPGRICVVVTSKPNSIKEVGNVVIANSLDDAFVKANNTGKDVCVIGGMGILIDSLNRVEELSITIISKESMKTPDWTKEITYLDSKNVIAKAEENGLHDFKSISLGTCSVTILYKGAI